MNDTARVYFEQELNLACCLFETRLADSKFAPLHFILVMRVIRRHAVTSNVIIVIPVDV